MPTYLGKTWAVLLCWRGEKNNPTWWSVCLLFSCLLRVEYCVTRKADIAWTRGRGGLVCSVRGASSSKRNQQSRNGELWKTFAKESFHPDSCKADSVQQPRMLEIISFPQRDDLKVISCCNFGCFGYLSVWKVSSLLEPYDGLIAWVTQLNFLAGLQAP